MRWLNGLFLLIAVVASASHAYSQTYFGRPTVPANSGPGGSCCSTVAQQTNSNAPVPTDGSCASCSVISQSQYNAYQSAVGIAPTTARSYNTAINTGITLTCTTTPSLSGTYAVNQMTMTFLNTIIGYYVANGNVFPVAAQSLTIQDTAGGLHTFPSLAAFSSFYKIVAVYWVQLTDWEQRVIAGQSPTAPASASSAC